MENNSVIKKKLELYMGIVMIAIIYACSINAGNDSVGVYNQIQDKVTIMVDAGHGGNDPGKVSVSNDLEKDINLQIALKLRDILNSQDIEVVMTRETDVGLYEDGATNKKVSDMKERVELAKDTNVDMVVSIHANSYVNNNVCGAQVFYYKGSEGGKKLAELIQNNISKVSILNSKRVAKSNDDYYMLRNVIVPSVIVECGFLSNPTETSMLKSEDYQRKIAWSIHLGIMEYLNMEI